MKKVKIRKDKTCWPARRVTESNLWENGQQQGTKLEEDNVSILDELFSLRNSILNS
jgi:hypothetical protein